MGQRPSKMVQLFFAETLKSAPNRGNRHELTLAAVFYYKRNSCIESSHPSFPATLMACIFNLSRLSTCIGGETSMDNPIKHYWQLRLEALKETLEKNRFEAHIAADEQEAVQLAAEQIIPAAAPRKISWGGSMTFAQSGLFQLLKERNDLDMIDTFDKSISKEQAYERRRQALLTDLFITGTNAVTEKGQLVNLDMIGNRVAALTFGPKVVIVMVGRNKLVPDLNAAMDRIKQYAAPANVLRLDKKNPCSKTGGCHDCSSSDRICNHWTITEKSFPKGRIKVILINQDLGL
jgi:L-lactate utilization protein LutC